LRSIPDLSDFTNATGTDPDKRRALASLIRDACNNVKVFIFNFGSPLLKYLPITIP
jgi:hypothetical protein